MTKPVKRKSSAAASLGRKRWEGVDKATRSALMRRAVQSRWRKREAR